jgi:hypothetical protein
MKAEEIEYIRYRLSKALETLQEANALYANGFTMGVVNRVYYACFYAVSALLLSEGYSSARHSGVISLFERHWIKPGRLPSGIGEFYRNMFKRHHQGDYEDMASFEKSDVEPWLVQAAQFIDAVSKCTEEQIAEA